MKCTRNFFLFCVLIKKKMLTNPFILPIVQKVKNFRSEVAKLLEQGFYRSAIRKLWKNSKKFRGSLLTFLSVIIKNEMKGTFIGFDRHWVTWFTEQRICDICSGLNGWCNLRSARFPEGYWYLIEIYFVGLVN